MLNSFWQASCSGGIIRVVLLVVLVVFSFCGFLVLTTFHGLSDLRAFCSLEHAVPYFSRHMGHLLASAAWFLSNYVSGCGTVNAVEVMGARVSVQHHVVTLYEHLALTAFLVYTMVFFFVFSCTQLASWWFFAFECCVVQAPAVLALLYWGSVLVGM